MLLIEDIWYRAQHLTQGRRLVSKGITVFVFALGVSRLWPFRSSLCGGPRPLRQGFGKLPKEKIPGAREPQAHREMAAVKLKECVGALGLSCHTGQG